MRVDYDRVAPTYRTRYEHVDYTDVGASVHDLVRGARSALELGCGAGHWLGYLAGTGAHVVGIDPSLGMLLNAPEAMRRSRVTQGTAEALPFPDGSFDVVFAVNAAHHFTDLAKAVSEAARVLRPQGRFATVGLDPSTQTDEWYIYDHFPGTLERDRDRYPSTGQVRSLLKSAGFGDVGTSVAQHMVEQEPAERYLQSPAFHRDNTSQLSLLNDAEFEEGVARIQAEISQGERLGKPAVLIADLRLYLTVGTLLGGAA